MCVIGLSLKQTVLMVMTESYSLTSVHSSAQQATPGDSDSRKPVQLFQPQALSKVTRMFKGRANFLIGELKNKHLKKDLELARWLIWYATKAD